MTARTALPFRDRLDAADRLAQALRPVVGEHPLILAIPRGAVPMAQRIAAHLHGELDVVLVRKLGAPGNPEFAVGAIDEDGCITLAEHASLAGADADYVEREAERQLAVIRERRARYRPGRPAASVAGRTVVVVDDGLATGATMAAALRAVRARGPAHLVCAVPVAAHGSLERISRLADDVVCLATPTPFHAVGEFYLDFAPVEDEDVITMLARQPPDAGGGGCRPVRIPAGPLTLEGELCVPDGARGVVVFAHGSGSSRHSPRNRAVAATLRRNGLATLLFDLLTAEEDADRAARFDIGRLADRLDAAVDWAHGTAPCAGLRIGLFGASTGAAAALHVAARRPEVVAAVVSRGGRPDLVPEVELRRVRAPTLLLVGGADAEVLALNRAVAEVMRPVAELKIVPRATHLFEEPGCLEAVADSAAAWFQRWLGADHRPVSP